MHSGLNLAGEDRCTWGLRRTGKGLARIASRNADATGAKARIDDRAVAAKKLPKLLPFGGVPGFRRGTIYI